MNPVDIDKKTIPEIKAAIDIDIADLIYELPENRIAQYPVIERDMSKLLILNNNIISEKLFKDIDEFIPCDTLLVFNNTRVIRARIHFLKDTGATVEVFCLEPLIPPEYELAFGSKGQVVWKCLIGNLKKWKRGILAKTFKYKEKVYELTAEKLQASGDAWEILFRWDCSEISFGEVIECIGHIPLPPYINREDKEEDLNRYQTVYARIKGSVAAPTAGLHFTEHVLEKIRKKGIKSAEVTLHVGAGTFQPIKSLNVLEHEMHCEHFSVTEKDINLILENADRIIAVGTTSVRSLESLYWIGCKLIKDGIDKKPDLSVGQWEAYYPGTRYSAVLSLQAILGYMNKHVLSSIDASTRIMIVPGYEFRLVRGIITNFHQPGSTLLLLVSAWIGNRWRDIYRYALDNDFRFLSYGDCNLLFR